MTAPQSAEASADREPEPPEIDAMEFYVDGDPHDHFPWKFAAYLPESQQTEGVTIGSISTPNGRRPDGSMHTYWSVVGDVWEPTAIIICRAVNEVAAARYGTPNPESVYA